MGALFVKGKIVGVEKRTFKKKSNGEQFQIGTYYVINGEGRPVEFKTFDVSRKQGDSVECPVYLKFWRDDQRSGCDLMEIIPKK